MDIKEKALDFAVKAHNGQTRKAEPDKPMIMHPISTANILEEYNADDHVIAAGYLHDVVEDTDYTIKDIVKMFGSDIGMLVDDATEPDKNLPWEVRKQDTIDYAKKLPLRRKLVICADKISNLEDTMLLFQKNGKKDFSAFKRGEDKQKWYYTNIYKSLIQNEDENLPIFKRLKNALEIVFYDEEDEYLKSTIFKGDEEYYLNLKKLHAQKEELIRLKKLCTLAKPFVIEFSGTPRTGKTSTINNLYDFFTKGGFDVDVIREFTTSNYYKEVFRKKYKNVSNEELNKAIIEEVYKELLENIEKNSDIILIDRSLNDRQIWNYRGYKNGSINENTYNSLRDEYSKISKELIDYLVITYTNFLESLKRDYKSSLSLEKRNFLNAQNIDNYNMCLSQLYDLLGDSVDSMLFINTTNNSQRDTSVIAASNIMPVMRRKYIDSFKQKYNIK